MIHSEYLVEFVSDHAMQCSMLSVAQELDCDFVKLPIECERLLTVRID